MCAPFILQCFFGTGYTGSGRLPSVTFFPGSSDWLFEILPTKCFLAVFLRMWCLARVWKTLPFVFFFAPGIPNFRNICSVFTSSQELLSNTKAQNLVAVQKGSCWLQFPSLFQTANTFSSSPSPLPGVRPMQLPPKVVARFLEAQLHLGHLNLDLSQVRFQPLRSTKM